MPDRRAFRATLWIDYQDTVADRTDVRSGRAMAGVGGFNLHWKRIGSTIFIPAFRTRRDIGHMPGRAVGVRLGRAPGPGHRSPYAKPDPGRPEIRRRRFCVRSPRRPASLDTRRRFVYRVVRVEAVNCLYFRGVFAGRCCRGGLVVQQRNDDPEVGVQIPAPLPSTLKFMNVRALRLPDTAPGLLFFSGEGNDRRLRVLSPPTDGDMVRSSVLG